MAVLKKAIFGVANGEVYPRAFEAGEECPVELEDAAIEAGALTKKQRSADPAAAQAEADAAAAAQAEAAAAQAEAAAAAQAEAAAAQAEAAAAQAATAQAKTDAA